MNYGSLYALLKLGNGLGPRRSCWFQSSFNKDPGTKAPSSLASKGRMSGGTKKKNSRLDTELSEVDEILKATEDELLLKLQINSHSVSSSSSASYLDSDLSRRFEALKKPTGKNSPVTSANRKHDPSGSIGGESIDLDSRFAALKNKAAPHPSSHLRQFSNDDDNDDSEGDDDGVSKKEVDKLVEWAKDAARLDPSLDSDDDDVIIDEDNDSNSESEEEEREKKKNDRKGKGVKSKKWFFF